MSLPRILIIDDDVMLAMSLRRGLQADRQIDVVDCAETALRRVIDGERYDVIVADLKMPGLDGMQLHTHLLDIDPEQARRFCLITGESDPALAKQCAQRGIVMLTKPFGTDALNDVIELLR